MAPRRWLLLAFALGSLVALVYASILVAFSVPVTDEMAAGMPGVSAGQRAVVVPIPQMRLGDTSHAWRDDTLLVVANTTTAFPASSVEPRLVRAMAYVAPPDANGTYVPEFLNFTAPSGGEGNDTAANASVSVNLSAMAEGRSGFLVRTDADGNITFVASDQVVGEVARFERGSSITLLFVSAAIGFVMPLMTLVLTHKPTGRRGAAALVCAECRAPLSEDGDFCLHCGAWRQDRNR